MNKDHAMVDASSISTTSSDMQLCPASPDAQEIFRRSVDNSDDLSIGNVRPISVIKPHQQNPRKKRTKMIRLSNNNSSSVSKAIVGVSSGSHSSMISKPKYAKKPDPGAPKITRPCSECGKRFWSWKALFGHMRCHPERPWRGINPPANIHHQPQTLMITGTSDHEDWARLVTEEDRQVAGCLLMLAHGPSLSDTGLREAMPMEIGEFEGPGGHTGMNCRFECSSCKKVFGSHQALGGHRASHKNVKGCFAITRNDGGEEVEEGEIVGHFERNGEEGEANNNNMMMVLGTSSQQQQHKCSICLRVFSSGQALGGHKRCHWEKEDVVVPSASTSVLSQGGGHSNASLLPLRFDLNLPAPLVDQENHSTSSSLDLRLGL